MRKIFGISNLKVASAFPSLDKPQVFTQTIKNIDGVFLLKPQANKDGFTKAAAKSLNKAK